MEQYLNLEKLAATAFAIDKNLKTQAETAGNLISDIRPAHSSPSLARECPLLALFGHPTCTDECPLSGVKRT
jgi:hypothetical protein